MQERLRVLSEWMAGLRGPHGLGMLHGVCLSAVSGMMALVWALWRKQREQARAGVRERAMWEELEAYARLDVSLGMGGDAKPLAKRVCKAVVEKSRFQRVAMLVRDAEGKLFVAGSAGMDDVTVGALQEWGVGVIRQERGLGPAGPMKVSVREKMGAGSFGMVLTPSDGFEAFVAERDGRQVMVTMLRGATGAVLGALVVGVGEEPVPGTAMAPLEALAVKLARTIENA